MNSLTIAALFLACVLLPGTVGASDVPSSPPASNEAYICSHYNLGPPCITVEAGKTIDPTIMPLVASFWLGGGVKIIQTNPFNSFVPAGGWNPSKYPGRYDKLGQISASDGSVESYIVNNGQFRVQEWSQMDDQAVFTYTALNGEDGTSCYVNNQVPGTRQMPPTYDITDAPGSDGHGVYNNVEALPMMHTNQVYVGGGNSLVLWTDTGLKGKSKLIVGPATVCLAADSTFRGANNKLNVGSMQMMQTWTKITGQWKQTIAPSNTIVNHAISYGYSWSKSSETSTSFSQTFNATASVSYKYLGVDASATVSTSEASSTTQVMSQAFSETMTTTDSATCVSPHDKNKEEGTSYNFVALYQFAMSGESPLDTNNPATTIDNNFLCIYSETGNVPYPKCIPVLCKDEMCQECCSSVDDCADEPAAPYASALKKTNNSRKKDAEKRKSHHHRRFLLSPVSA